MVNCTVSSCWGFLYLGIDRPKPVKFSGFHTKPARTNPYVIDHIPSSLFTPNIGPININYIPLHKILLSMTVRNVENLKSKCCFFTLFCPIRYHYQSFIPFPFQCRLFMASGYDPSPQQPHSVLPGRSTCRAPVRRLSGWMFLVHVNVYPWVIIMQIHTNI